MGMFDSVRQKLFGKKNVLSQQEINSLRKQYNSHLAEEQNKLNNSIKKDKENKIEKLTKLIESIEKIVKIPNNKNIVFVEGASDKIIFDKIIELSGRNKKSIEVVNCQGATKMQFYAILWLHQQSLKTKNKKALFVFDNDDAGKEHQKITAKELQKNTSVAKTYKLGKKTLENYYEKFETLPNNPDKIKLAKWVAKQNNFKQKMNEIYDPINKILENNEM